MKLHMIIANPAGNITAIVTDSFDRGDYQTIARKLMAMKDFNIEQVGFEEPASGCDGHIQMMGGEFCGNASRSYGLYLIRSGRAKQRHFAVISISGTDQLLNIEANEALTEALVGMPPVKGFQMVETNTLGSLPLVEMEGISHVLVIDNNAETISADKNSPLMEELIGRLQAEAIGIMYYNPEQQFLKPYIWVGQTATGIWESSCGSGSVALAAYLHREEDEDFQLQIHEPGGILKVFRQHGVIKLGGPIHISDVITVDIKDGE